MLIVRFPFLRVAVPPVKATCPLAPVVKKESSNVKSALILRFTPEVIVLPVAELLPKVPPFKLTVDPLAPKQPATPTAVLLPAFKLILPVKVLAPLKVSVPGEPFWLNVPFEPRAPDNVWLAELLKLKVPPHEIWPA